MLKKLSYKDKKKKKLRYIHTHVVGLSGKVLGHFKQVIRVSNPDSCIWRKPGREERTHILCA